MAAGVVGASRPTEAAVFVVPWPPASRALTAIVAVAVALSLSFMQQRSSGTELAAILRTELNRYSPGEKLPSSRALVERHRVSPVTVSRALAELAAEGLVTTRPGAGAFRAEPRSEAPRPVDTSWQEIALSAEPAGDQVPRSVDASGVVATLGVPGPGVVELNGGYLHSDLQPERALGAALARAGRRPGAWGGRRSKAYRSCGPGSRGRSPGPADHSPPAMSWSPRAARAR